MYTVFCPLNGYFLWYMCDDNYTGMTGGTGAITTHLLKK